MEIRVRREIAASAQRVWDVVTDLEGSVEVLSAVEHIERLDDLAEFGVGTRWRETRTMFGRQATEELRVTAADPPRGYTVVADSGSTVYTSTLAVTPLEGQRCELEMSFAGESSGVVGRLLAATLGRLFAGSTRKALQQDLDDLAQHAELHEAG